MKLLVFELFKIDCNMKKILARYASYRSNYKFDVILLHERKESEIFLHILFNMCI